MRKTVSLLLSVVLLFTAAAFALPAFAADNLSELSGTCGDNITWTLKDGVLTVSGEGVLAPQQYVKEAYERDEWSNTNQVWQKVTEPAQTVWGFPWGSDIIAAACGYRNWDEAENGLLKGEISYSELMIPKLVKKIVIEEGITEIVGGAFSCFTPETIVLPSTLERMTSSWKEPDTNLWISDAYDPNFNARFTKDLFVLNPEIQIDPENDISLGYTWTDGRYADYAAYKAGGIETIDALGQWYGPYRFVLEKIDFGMSYVFGAVHQAIFNHTYVTPEGRDTYVDGYLEMNRPELENFGITYADLDSYEIAMITRLNELLETDFKSMDDLFVVDEQHPVQYGGEKVPVVEHSDIFMAAVERFSEKYYADVKEAGGFLFGYSLGQKPEIEFDEGPETVYPCSGLTVHAAADSTAAQAAAVSGIKVAPLCPADALHPVTDQAAVAATCTAAGHTAGWYCPVCETWLTGETVAPLSHKNAQGIAATEPAADAHGYTAGVYCPDCKIWLSGHDVIHNQLGAQTVLKEATQTAQGEVSIVCTVCGESRTYPIEKLPHNEKSDGRQSFFDWLRAFFQRIIDWFRHLFR